MPRARSPDRDKAFELYLIGQGETPLKDIAESLNLSEGTIRGWKAKDDWEGRLNGTLQTKERNAPKKLGAPEGNKNAVGNIGGRAPVGNSNAVTHGFFRRIFPDDEDTHAILAAIETLEPLDILWQNIVIQYTAIARAQRIMFVQDAVDHSEFTVVHQLNSDGSEMTTKMIQPAWDKHGEFLKAQSRAIQTLEGLIARYVELLPSSSKAEENRLRVQKLQAEVARLKGDDGETEDDGFLDALHAEAGEVWTDDDGDET